MAFKIFQQMKANDITVPDWLDRHEYPFESKWFGQQGHHQHYIDEGEGEILLFVHGTPSWSFDFRHLVKHFRNHYRCIAIDHMGFGLSEKPKDYPYSTIRHSENLERFILEKDLKDITLVLHDFGGPIGLNVAIQHPQRFKRLVVLNSWMWSSEADPDFQKLKKILRSPILPILYKYLNFSAAFILPGSFGEKKLSRKLKAQYTRPFSKSSERIGPLAFAESLRDDQDWFEELWNKRQAIAHLPILFVWGMKDPAIKAHHLRKFQEGFPNHTALEMQTVGHFPQEEAPERLIPTFEKWLSKTSAPITFAAKP